jgi:hypothetical protein
MTPNKKHMEKIIGLDNYNSFEGTKSQAKGAESEVKSYKYKTSDGADLQKALYDNQDSPMKARLLSFRQSHLLAKEQKAAAQLVTEDGKAEQEEAAATKIQSVVRRLAGKNEANTLRTEAAAKKEASATSSENADQLEAEAKPEQYILSPEINKLLREQAYSDAKNSDRPSDLAVKMLYASVKEMIAKITIPSPSQILMIEDVKPDTEAAKKVSKAVLAEPQANAKSPSIGTKTVLVAIAVTAVLAGLSGVIGHALAQAGAALTISILPAVAAFMLTPAGIGLGIGLLLATTALVGYLTTPKATDKQPPTMTATPATSSSLENTSATEIQSLFDKSPSGDLSTENTGASAQTPGK